MLKRWWIAFVVVVAVAATGTMVVLAASGSSTPAGMSALEAAGAKEPAAATASTSPLEVTGGDTCALATVIGSIPYEDSGTTTGQGDDYNPECEWGGSTAPDVVYSFTPASDMTVDISLCSPGTDTNYDTKLAVYEGDCTTTPIGCNDDACSSPLFANYVSELTGVCLTGGVTYYIVVDGYSSNDGNYTISVDTAVPPTPAATCDGTDLLLGQEPHTDADGWSAGSSCQASWATSPLAIFEGFDGTDVVVDRLRWWGMSMFFTGSGWNACDPTAGGGMTFDIVFYPDDGTGLPDTSSPICSYDGVAAAMTDIGGSYAGNTLFQFDIATLTPSCTLSADSWMMIQSEPMATGDCGFLWMSAFGCDPHSMQDDGTTIGDTGYGRGMCLHGSVVPVELQSFTIQ